MKVFDKREPIPAGSTAASTKSLDEHLESWQSYSTPVCVVWKDVCKYVYPTQGKRKHHVLMDAVKAATTTESVRSSGTNTPGQDLAVDSASGRNLVSNPGAGAKKQILFNVNGVAYPGKVMALMGPSGSGKTTLLNLLGCRAMANVTGQILLNNQPISKTFKSLVGYVMQEDMFFMHLSVRDQLRVAALLRLPKHISKEQKLQEVDRVIGVLGLHKCAETKIMMCSGGEKKRVNIGTELLSDPSILLLDEPTSGLDSSSAYGLIVTVKKLAQLGKTIITSIHQPSSQVFYSFDWLLLLCDGHTVFSGKPSDCTAHIAHLGFAAPADYNPSDFVMDLVSATPTMDWGAGGDEEEGKAAVGGGGGSDDDIEGDNSGQGQVLRALPKYKLMDAWDNDKEEERVAAQVNSTKDQYSTMPVVRDIKANRISWLSQVSVLLNRCAKNTQASIFTTLNMVQSVLLAIVTGIMFFQLKYTESDINDRAGALFFVMVYWPFQALFAALMSIPSELAIINKERASGSYQLSAYFIAKSVSETPVRLVLPTIFLVICYPMVGMTGTAKAFLGTCGVELMAVLAGESFGLAIGCNIGEQEKAIAFGTVLLLSLMLTGGFFTSSVPSWIEWTKYASPFSYAYDASLVFQVDRDLPCDGSGVIEQCTIQGAGTTITPGETLNFLGQDLGAGFSIGMLALMFVGLRVLAYLGLRYRKHNTGRE